MDLPPCTLYLNHLRMIERLVALDDDDRLREGVWATWTVEVEGVDWSARTANGLLASVPDRLARIDAIKYRAKTYHMDGGRMRYDEYPWDETTIDLGKQGGRVAFEVFGSGEHVDEQMAWVERQVLAICEHCPPTRDGAAALWDRPVPWPRLAWDSVKDPGNVGRAVWAVSGGLVGAAVTQSLN